MFTRLFMAVLLAFSLVLPTTLAGPATLAQLVGPYETRFDDLVRADFFAGLAGDEAAFERAMQVIEATLSANPQRAEALVWHGSGLLVRAGQAFQKGDFGRGGDLWTRGLKEMDDAVAMEPENVGVVIPRGATLLEASREMPDPVQSRSLLARGVADYEKVLALQAPYFTRLSVHARGELLFGLAEGLHRLGETERARNYFRRVTDEVKGSIYESKASEWLKESPLTPKAAAGCAGCHTK